MFNLKEYLNGLDVTDGSDGHDILCDAKNVAKSVQIVCDDAYLARATFWGMAAAMENQANYLGSRLIPNYEARLNNIEGRGFMSESDVGNKWFANEDKPHVNDDITIEDQIDNMKRQLDQANLKLMRAAVMFVVYVRNHDELSHTLDQPSYAHIKQKAETNRRLGMGTNRTAA